METNNPHVVQQLRPVSRDGRSELTYQLDKSSVSPSRIVGRDARGFPISETVPTVMWKPFLESGGCINKVPIRTGSVPSMHADAVAYENETFYDLIVAGWIPAWMCPYSTHYTHITHGPFARPENGETDCGGSTAEGGCVHLQKIGKMRREAVLREHNERLEVFASQHKQEFERMRDGIVEGVGKAIASHVMPAAASAQQRVAQRAKQQFDEGKEG
jgi:hypothetical protein